MTDKYEALKAAALAATPGQWTYQDVPGAGLQIRVPYQGSTRLVFSDIWRQFPEAVWDAQMVCNAAYVEAASPDVVLALIAERDALAAKVKQMEAQEEVELTCVGHGTTTTNGRQYVYYRYEYDFGQTYPKALYLAPGANPDAKVGQSEPVAYMVYAKGSRRYFTLTFDIAKVPEMYIGGGGSSTLRNTPASTRSGKSGDAGET